MANDSEERQAPSRRPTLSGSGRVKRSNLPAVLRRSGVSAVVMALALVAACASDETESISADQPDATDLESSDTTAPEVQVLSEPDDRFTTDCGASGATASFEGTPFPSGGPADIEAAVPGVIEEHDGVVAHVLIAPGPPPGRFTDVNDTEPEEQLVAVLDGGGETTRVSQFVLVDGGWTLRSSEFCG